MLVHGWRLVYRYDSFRRSTLQIKYRSIPAHEAIAE